jgi:hypothetical protein
MKGKNLQERDDSSCLTKKPVKTGLYCYSYILATSAGLSVRLSEIRNLSEQCLAPVGIMIVFSLPADQK